MAELQEANAVVEHAKTNSEFGPRFSSTGLDWNDMVLCTITDASFANVEVELKSEREPLRSQQGLFHVLASPDVVNGNRFTVHPIGWSSTSIRRVCRATMQTETYAMTDGVESGLRLRGAIVDAMGLLDMRDWEKSSGKHLRHVWLTD